MMTQGTDIARADYVVPGKLALDTEIELLDFLPLAHVDVGEVRRASRTGSDVLISGNIVSEQIRRGQRITIESGAVLQRIAAIPRERIPSADSRFAVSERIPGEADPRRPGAVE